LGVLRFLAPGNTIQIPETVELEIRQAPASHVWLPPILDQPWIVVTRLSGQEELLAYGRYVQRLVGDDARNTGECGVLALAEVHGHVAVVDDHAGVKAGTAAGVTVRRTLRLLCDAIEEGQLTVEMVSGVADSLLESGYRLPLPPGGFVRWALDSGRISAHHIPSKMKLEGQ
jgi:predicted nucleic acid-binding protein